MINFVGKCPLEIPLRVSVCWIDDSPEDSSCSLGSCSSPDLLTFIYKINRKMLILNDEKKIKAIEAALPVLTFFNVPENKDE